MKTLFPLDSDSLLFPSSPHPSIWVPKTAFAFYPLPPLRPPPGPLIVRKAPTSGLIHLILSGYRFLGVGCWGWGGTQGISALPVVGSDGRCNTFVWGLLLYLAAPTPGQLFAPS